MSGTPTAAQVGVYREISIRVSAGGQIRALASFDLEVVQVGLRSVTLSWMAPTHNEDGSPLLNLAGYRIRYGEQAGSYPNVISLSNPGLATYVVDSLAPGSYYFVVSAYSQSGTESAYSAVARTTLQ